LSLRPFPGRGLPNVCRMVCFQSALAGRD
jgi:hypothetical protein